MASPEGTQGSNRCVCVVGGGGGNNRCVCVWGGGVCVGGGDHSPLDTSRPTG